jgi:hypothetical protein
MQPDAEPFLAPLDNFPPWERPSDSIELFAGPMSYRRNQADNLPSVPGRICFWSRAGSSHIQWSVGLDAADPAIAEEWQLPEPDHTLGELHFDFLGQPMTVGAYRQSRDYGWIPGGLGQFGSASKPVRVLAHWISLPSCSGKPSWANQARMGACSDGSADGKSI